MRYLPSVFVRAPLALVGYHAGTQVRRAIMISVPIKWRAPALAALAIGLRCLVVCLALLAANAVADEPVNPLKPVDRSSPRATLQSFLESGDALGAFLVQDYLPSPSRERFQRLLALAETVLQGLDLSEVPPAARQKTGRSAAVALYEVLSRIPLPPLAEIPDASQVVPPTDKAPTRWVIPNTEIALVRASSGPRSGEFLFSAETVARANEFYERVHQLPYTRPLPLKNPHEIFAIGGGWMVPYAWIQSLPASLRTPIANQSRWKWIGFCLLVGLLAVFLWFAYRVSQMGRQQSPFVQALAQFAMPASLLAAVPAVAYLALVQLNLAGSVGSAIELVMTTTLFLAGAWMAWRLAPVVAEGIIASPRIAPESVDAHVIRVATRLLGIFGGMALLAMGADRLGVPVYGVVAGLGVGGLAIALAARPSVENLIGGMSLFADKPIRVGDFCKYGDMQGTVEAIGLRSSRLRGPDRTVTTIPNAAMARMPIVNLTQRDRMLLKAVIGLRCETTPEQLRHILVQLRELLLSHPRVSPEPARARFIALGASSLDIEVFAYVMTRDSAEFLGIQEDILLRIMDIVEQSGTAFAFPSQTLYLGRDHGPDDTKRQAAEAVVRKWREEGNLPFPNFSPEQASRLRDSIAYPPAGSSTRAAVGNPAAAQDAAGETDKRPR